MTRPSILMIDPSPESVELARFSVWRSKLDCSFGWFEDAEQAAESLFTAQAAAAPDALPCLILLESHLPRMDAIEFLRMVRSHPHTDALPVVMFSSTNEEPDVAMALGAGANSYLLKPVDAREFMTTVVDTVSHWLKYKQPAG